ncbi:MAG: nitrilase-related carbon-nitrogen hydrolase, partial [Armatimonadota bacterium]
MSLIPFDSPFRHGFVRVAVSSPAIVIANPKANADSIVKTIQDAEKEYIQVLVTPELGLCGYTCDELFHQRVLQQGVLDALRIVCESTAETSVLTFVGAPIRVGAKLFNCAVAICNGYVLGIVPKQHLPGYREYYEPRYFTPYSGDVISISINGHDVPFGNGLLFQLGDDPSALVGVEICEDAWVPDTPATHQALAGATIICNLSASNVTTGK